MCDRPPVRPVPHEANRGDAQRAGPLSPSITSCKAWFPGFVRRGWRRRWREVLPVPVGASGRDTIDAGPALDDVPAKHFGRRRHRRRRNSGRSRPAPIVSAPTGSAVEPPGAVRFLASNSSGRVQRLRGGDRVRIFRHFRRSPSRKPEIAAISMLPAGRPAHRMRGQRRDPASPSIKRIDGRAHVRARLFTMVWPSGRRRALARALSG